MLLTDLTTSAVDLCEVSILAADAGIPAEVVPIVLDPALIEVEGWPEADIYVVRCSRRWHPADAETARVALDAGWMVGAIGCSKRL